MLCSESAVGMYCDKAVDVLTSISTQIEEWCRSVLRLFVRTLPAPFVAGKRSLGLFSCQTSEQQKINALERSSVQERL